MQNLWASSQIVSHQTLSHKKDVLLSAKFKKSRKFSNYAVAVKTTTGRWLQHIYSLSWFLRKLLSNGSFQKGGMFYTKWAHFEWKLKKKICSIIATYPPSLIFSLLNSIFIFCNYDGFIFLQKFDWWVGKISCWKSDMFVMMLVRFPLFHLSPIFCSEHDFKERDNSKAGFLIFWDFVSKSVFGELSSNHWAKTQISNFRLF